MADDKKNTLEYSRGYVDGIDGYYKPPEKGFYEIIDYDEGFDDGNEAAKHL